MVLIISRADVPPIIATMGFMYIYRALGYQVSHGGEWASAAALGNFKNFATTKFLGLNAVIWVIIVCYVFFFWFMKWTRTGRMIYAVGSNPSAAEVSGINVKNIKLLVYTIMGLLAGLGGALQVSVYASAMPDMQYGGEMDVIAACVIGGVSMSGGRGTVIGALTWIPDPCNNRKSTSADSILQPVMAEYHQGCYHPRSSSNERNPAAYR